MTEDSPSHTDDSRNNKLTMPSPQSSAAERYIHSDVWDRLVESKDDLAGIVAYGLYQQRKREWIDDCKENTGSLPCEDQVKNYSYGFRNSALKALRDEAEGIMFRFGEEYAESKLPELQMRAFNSRTALEIATARDELKLIRDEIAEKSGYVHHVKTHIAGFFALAALIALVTLAVSYEKSPRGC